jgi:hypothetical protein
MAITPLIAVSITSRQTPSAAPLYTCTCATPLTLLHLHLRCATTSKWGQIRRYVHGIGYLEVGVVV